MSQKAISAIQSPVQLQTFPRILVTLLIGTCIHALNSANNWISYGDIRFVHLPLFAQYDAINTSFSIVTPYLIPLLILTFLSKTTKTANSFDVGFFDLNPDIIIKTDLHANIVYANPVATSLACTINPNKEINSLFLPKDFQEMITAAINNKKYKLGLEHHVENRIFDYAINISYQMNTVFISGRDISERRIIENRLLDSQNIIRDMSELIDRIFSNYDPLSFELQPYFTHLVEIFLKPKLTDRTKQPTHLLLASIQSDENYQGYVYHVFQDEVVRSQDMISIDRDHLKSLNSTRNEVFFATSDDKIKSELLHKLFSTDINSFTDNAHGFAIFRSGKIAIAAFYENESIGIFDAMILKALAIYSNALFQISIETRATDDAFVYAIDALARASEISDTDTGSHIKRINEYSRVLASQMSLPKEFIQTISYSAQMHDIGKVHTPTEILNKHGLLEPEERLIMQKHSLAGSRILGTSPRLAMAADIAKYHHERYDGSGYPMGLKGQDIPLAARIVAVADVYDALREKRSYKPAMTHNEAIHVLTQGDEQSSPKHFDPEVLQALVEAQDKFDEIFSRHTE